MKNKYGYFSNEQMEKYKVKLHKELFWLLVYKDPDKKDEYVNVDFNKYFMTIFVILKKFFRKF